MKNRALLESAGLPSDLMTTRFLWYLTAAELKTKLSQFGVITDQTLLLRSLNLQPSI